MEAKEQGREVGGQENVDEIGKRVVVSCSESVGRRKGVVPGRVERSEERGGGVEGVTVQSVSEDLCRSWLAILPRTFAREMDK